MPPAEFRILAINPGSTSTKMALYVNERPEFVKNIRHSDAEMAQFRGRPILDQQQFRSAQIEAALSEAGHNVRELDAVVGRGGLLPALASGTYVVNEEMLEELRLARRGEHAANLGAFLATTSRKRPAIQAYVVDPVSVDEWPECARLSGSALLERQCLSHALNSKAVAKRYARERGKPYESLRLIVAHLGSGISVSAHENGLMVDVTNSREEGAFSTERAGGVPAMQLVDLCFSGKYTQKQVEALLFREGGLYSYLGTKDLVEVERRIAAWRGKGQDRVRCDGLSNRERDWGDGGRPARTRGRRAPHRRHGAFTAFGLAADRVRKLDRSHHRLSGRGRTAGAHGRRIASAAP